MKVSLEGEKVVLVPYMKEHVPRYHVWMQDPAILRSTASEPLSLDQEYEMQLSWVQDPFKQTFVVLDKLLVVEDFIHGEPHTEAMVGDVNIFMNDPDDPQMAEVEIMIAEQNRASKRILAVRYSKRIFGPGGMSENLEPSQLSSKRSDDHSTISFRFREITLELPVTKSKGEELHHLIANVVTH